MTGRAGQTLRTRHSLQPDRARFALCARRSALAGQAGRSRRSGGPICPHSPTTTLRSSCAERRVAMHVAGW
ncbi:hypothetical protein ACFQFG_10710 [Methylobacterium persicinum]